MTPEQVVVSATYEIFVRADFDDGSVRAEVSALEGHQLLKLLDLIFDLAEAEGLLEGFEHPMLETFLGFAPTPPGDTEIYKITGISVCPYPIRTQLL